MADFFTDKTDPVPIDVFIEDKDDQQVGTVFGVIHFDWEHLNNWLEKKEVTEDTIYKIQKLKNKFPIALLDNINVDEEERGKGYGNQGMSLFAEEASSEDSKTSLLIADLSEGQSKGFDLVAWYRSYGYRMIGRTFANDPVMFKKFT